MLEQLVPRTYDLKESESEVAMLDVIFTLAGIGFFVIAILYVQGCDWFIKDKDVTADQERIETSHEQAELV